MKKIANDILTSENPLGSIKKLVDNLVKSGFIKEACFTLEGCMRLAKSDTTREKFKNKIIDLNCTKCTNSYDYYCMHANTVSHEFPIKFDNENEKKFIMLVDKYMACIHSLFLIDSEKEKKFVKEFEKEMKKIKGKITKAGEKAQNQDLSAQAMNILDIAENALKEVRNSEK